MVAQGSPVVVVGAGTLGRALTHRINTVSATVSGSLNTGPDGNSAHNGGAFQGMRVVGLVDDDPRKVGLEYRSTAGGRRVHGDQLQTDAQGGARPIAPSLKVAPMQDINRLVSAFGVRTAVLATAADDAQGAADKLIAGGVKRILNYSLQNLQTPTDVHVTDAWEQTTRLFDLLTDNGAATSTPPTGLSRYANDFETVSRLGHGAFGAVWTARNRLDGRLYAVKKIVLRRLRDAELSQQGALGDLLSAYVQNSEARAYRWMLREVRAMAGIAPHPNVVRYHQSWLELADIADTAYSSESADSQSSSMLSLSSSTLLSPRSDGEDNSVGPTTAALLLCIQMELCEGQTLRELLNSRDETAAMAVDNKLTNGGRLPLELVIDIGMQVLQGVEHIHKEGFLHRDIKPCNIFLGPSDKPTEHKRAFPRIKIGDLGLCSELRPVSIDPAVVETETSTVQSQLAFESQHQYVGSGSTSQPGAGTWAYAAPEHRQCGNSSPPRSYNSSNASHAQSGDGFSIGIVLAELLHPGFRTGMERVKALDTVRFQRRLPSECLHGWKRSAIECQRDHLGRLHRHRTAAAAAAAWQQKHLGRARRKAAKALSNVVLGLTEPDPCMRMSVSAARENLENLANMLAAAASAVSSQSSIQLTAHTGNHKNKSSQIELDRVRCKLARIEFLREVETKALTWQLRRALGGDPGSGTGICELSMLK